MPPTKCARASRIFASHLPHIGDEVPARWLKVRADIEQLAAKQPYVPVEKYFEIYGRHIEFDEAKALLLSRYLHDLGVFLHFQDDPLLARTVILQNEWATEAVFRILDDETVKKKLGRFNSEDCARLWKDSRLRAHASGVAGVDAEVSSFAMSCATASPQTWLAPQLLPPTNPPHLLTGASPRTWCCVIVMTFCPRG